MPEWTDGRVRVRTHKSRISNSAELDDLEKRISIPVPEMVFGHNFLSVELLNQGATITFTAEPALDSVDKVLGERVRALQVANSAKWKENKARSLKELPPSQRLLNADVGLVHNPFDWTYTPFYHGTTTLIDFVKTDMRIPYDRLRQPDPILFFDEVQLYEDELGDFGLCTFSVKVRAMPTCVFLLARFYMRVDNVAFRIRDTRIFFDLNNKETIIRECQDKEGSFEFVKSKVPIWQEDYTALFRDPNWVDSVLPVESQTCELAVFA